MGEWIVEDSGQESMWELVKVRYLGFYGMRLLKEGCKHLSHVYARACWTTVVPKRGKGQGHFWDCLCLVSRFVMPKPASVCKRGKTGTKNR